ncbi:hypothetical protein RND71_040638 [Anisodus tanguticus]|uniref:Nuclear factor related to kappa-B-binding protein second winged helix domain-containing protein n=1 Tax=Anisodus tanguticus TaxID=243964 RepID=A0AAE1UTJ1_9SOLA|nr:hypothetical protein RND71_040638 [Anisodus tanguticus]
MENIVPNINPENLTYAPNHMGANISSVIASYHVMLSPHLLSSFGTVHVLPDLSPPRDVTSDLQFPEMNEMGGMLPFASNSGYKMKQMPIVPPEWNARLEALNITHCLITEVSPPAPEKIQTKLDESILENASRLRKFITCMSDSWIMCQRTRNDEGLMRDAAARLPGGVGTRADICVLVRDSQFIVEDISDLQVSQVVSGALDRLHYENDLCERFDKEWRLWAYLHGDRRKRAKENELRSAGGR